MNQFTCVLVAGTLFYATYAMGGKTTSQFSAFITAKADKLYDGDKELRFISYNIPNLHYVEDDMAFEKLIPFRFPNEFEIRDALLSIKQTGGQVVRLYTLSVRSKSDPPEMPRHVLGPGRFNEEAFIALDKCLQIANELGVRLIIPFVDNWKWWGGRGEYAAFRGKKPDDFWTEKEVIDDFKKTIDFVIHRRNTFTGTLYKDDKAILAWETGNELTCPPQWTREIASFIKQIDNNHLLIDGKHSSVLFQESLDDPNIDIVTTHHYQKDATEIVKLIEQNAKKVRGRKPYIVGEFGFINTNGVANVCDAVINSTCSGALIWSLRPHNRDGGFYWHSEPYGGNLFKSYHWPGFQSGDAFDERKCVELLRRKAFEISGKPQPKRQKPAPPKLLPIDSVSSISWQGSTGAGSYRIERADSDSGPWTTIADQLSDADVQYRPLYNDESVEIGKRYFYRIVAANTTGESAPSNSVRSSIIKHLTFIDECRDWKKTFKIFGSPSLKQDNARESKEDCHRFIGKAGDGIIYSFEESITAVKIFSFFSNDVINFSIQGSADGNTFADIEIDRFDYYSGSGEYNYNKPVLFRSKNLEIGYKYLKIAFPSPSEISRIEVHYGN